MKVDSQNPKNLKQLSMWEKDRGKEVQKKMKEIRKIQKRQIDELKHSGDMKIKKTQEQNQTKMNAEEKKIRERLNNLKLKLQQTKDQLQQEEALLKKKFEGRKIDLESRFNQDYLKEQDHYQDSLSKYSVVAEEAINKTKTDNADRMNTLVNDNKKTEAHFQNLHKNKISKDKVNFENVRMAKKSEHQNQLKKLESEQLREKQKMVNDFDRRMLTLKYEHEKQFNTLKKRFEQQIKQSDKDFKQRYKQVVDQNKNSLDAINDISKKSIKRIKEENEHIYLGVASKQSDPFYAISTLEPVIKNFDKHYEISIKVPDFDKDKVQLNGHDRQLKMTFNRNFTDKMVKQDGSDNRYGRIESFTKIFNVDEPINSKSLDEKYENGHLTFIIKKL